MCKQPVRTSFLRQRQPWCGAEVPANPIGQRGWRFVRPVRVCVCVWELQSWAYRDWWLTAAGSMGSHCRSVGAEPPGEEPTRTPSLPPLLAACEPTACLLRNWVPFFLRQVLAALHCLPPNRQARGAQRERERADQESVQRGRGKRGGGAGMRHPTHRPTVSP